MRTKTFAVPLVIGAIGSLLATSSTVASAHAGTPAATAHCKTQTVIWTHGKKHPLTMTKGKPTTSKITGGIDVTDGQVDAQWTLVTNGSVPAHFLNVTTNQTTANNTSVTVYPTKGKKKKLTVGKKSGFNYKLDLIYNVGQVMGPTSGDTGGARPTPKLKKEVVKVKECPAAQ